METKPWWQSKAVWTAIIGVVIGGIQPVSSALGHSIVIPQWVFEVLGSLGIYGLRVGDKTIG